MAEDEDDRLIEVRVVRLPERAPGRRRSWPAAWTDGRVWGTELGADDVAELDDLTNTLRVRATRARGRGEPVELAICKVPLEGRRVLVVWQMVRDGVIHPLLAEPGEVQPLSIAVAALTDPMDCPRCGALVEVNRDGNGAWLGSDASEAGDPLLTKDGG